MYRQRQEQQKLLNNAELKSAFFEEHKWSEKSRDGDKQARAKLKARLASRGEDVSWIREPGARPDRPGSRPIQKGGSSAKLLRTGTLTRAQSRGSASYGTLPQRGKSRHMF